MKIWSFSLSLSLSVFFFKKKLVACLLAAGWCQCKKTYSIFPLSCLLAICIEENHIVFLLAYLYAKKLFLVYMVELCSLDNFFFLLEILLQHLGFDFVFVSWPFEFKVLIVSWLFSYQNLILWINCSGCML